MPIIPPVGNLDRDRICSAIKQYLEYACDDLSSIQIIMEHFQYFSPPITDIKEVYHPDIDRAQSMITRLDEVNAKVDILLYLLKRTYLSEDDIVHV